MTRTTGEAKWRGLANKNGENREQTEMAWTANGQKPAVGSPTLGPSVGEWSVDNADQPSPGKPASTP